MHVSGMRRAPLRLATTAAVLVALLTATLLAATTFAQGAVTFRATITNTTNPEMVVTPGAYLVHTEAGAFWTTGSTASLALERIAEIGDSGEAVASLGATPLDAAPANGDTVTFEFTASPGDSLSFAQMVVATNDGFVGLDSLALWDGTTPISLTRDLVAYDAGTEENTDLFSGFDGGQPDPSRGADNVDNGAATAEPIGAHAQLSGTQATISIAPVVVAALPSTGSGGVADSDGGLDAAAVAALAALGLLVAGAAVRVVAERR